MTDAQVRMSFAQTISTGIKQNTLQLQWV